MDVWASYSTSPRPPTPGADPNKDPPCLGRLDLANCQEATELEKTEVGVFLLPFLGSLCDPRPCPGVPPPRPQIYLGCTSPFLLLAFSSTGEVKSLLGLLISQHFFFGSLNPTHTSESGPFVQVCSSEPSELLLSPTVNLTGTICTKSHLRTV